MIRKPLGSLSIAIIVALSQIQPANAHLVSTGLGPIYDGVYHFFLSPEEVLAVIALSLYAGLQGPAIARAVFFTLPIAWLAGTQSGFAPPTQTQAIFVATSFIGLGGLLATSATLPKAPVIAIAGAIGLWHGAADGMPGSAGFNGLLPDIGSFASIGVLCAITAALSLPLKRLWAIVFVRVAGSWIAALGLLLIGWSIHAARLTAH